MGDKIEGGYILQPRIIDDSDVMCMPPIIREIWSWLCRNVNFADAMVRRGQILTDTSSIKEGLKWRSGYRWEYYPLDRIGKALNRLSDCKMITIEKKPGKQLLVTVVNYNYYQNKTNYLDGGNTEATRRQQLEPMEAISVVDEKPTVSTFSLNLKTTEATTKTDGGNMEATRRQKPAMEAKTKKVVSPDKANNSADSKTTEAIPISNVNKNIILLNLSNDKFKGAELKSIFHICRMFFEEYYLTLKPEPYYWTVKDASNMKNILTKIKFLLKNKYKDKDESYDDGHILDSWCTILKNISADRWVSENFSIPNINSKFNELIDKIRTSNKQQQNGQKKTVSSTRAKRKNY